MPKRLVLTHDGSDLANAAVPYAAALARALEAEVTVLRVVEADVADRLDQRELVEAALSVVRAALEQAGAPSVRIAIRVGEAGPTILDEVRGGRADLLVMATHGRSGLRRATLGSVADYVLHNVADLPIVLCQPGRAEVTVARLLVPLDGSERAAAAIPVAKELALATGAAVTLLRTIDSVAQVITIATPAGYELEPALSVEAAEAVVEAQRRTATGDLETAARGLRAAGVSRVDCEVVEGVPGDAITSAAQRLPAELIVLSTRGRSGIGRTLLGSVADHVVRHADTGVVVVRPEVAG